MLILPYRGVWPTIANDVFIAPGAVVVGNVTIGEGASIWYNAVVRGDNAPIMIGRRTNVQDNCTLHMDRNVPLLIGEECTIGHNAVVHGATLGDRVMVGMNAVILSHARVGSRTIIGAGALVSGQKWIPEEVLAVGIPATVIRTLCEKELEQLKKSADGYYKQAWEHVQALCDTHQHE